MNVEKFYANIFLITYLSNTMYGNESNAVKGE